MATFNWQVPRGTAWTFGAEFELADWNQRRKHLWRLDMDWTMVNSNGIAVDPYGEVYHRGGEVLAHPSNSPEGVAAQLEEFVSRYTETTVNYRSNLHVHVRVPGLRDDLKRLKQVQSFCAKWLPTLLPIIEPIPQPWPQDYPRAEAWKGARARYARRKVSHQKIMPDATVERQLAARSCREFFEAEALHPASGALHWATKPRCAVNLRQLMATDTIEFRHFPGTISPAEALTAVEWCRAFLTLALNDGDPVWHYRQHFARRQWPKFKPYTHWMEVRFKATNAHYVGVEAARAAVQGMFNANHAGNLPRKSVPLALRGGADTSA